MTNAEHETFMDKVDHVLDPMNMLGNTIDGLSGSAEKDYTRETTVSRDTHEHVKGFNTHVDQTTDTHEMTIRPQPH